ncbi:hypothetical protein EXIGLDRAFT_838995, partial [Exidia glandulosa HHB12029]
MATNITKLQRWIPPPNASPQSTLSAPPREPSIEALRKSHPSPIAQPSTSPSPTASTLRREASSIGMPTVAHVHTHATSLGTVPEPGHAPSTPSPVVTRKEKIWQPPASEYERFHQEATANLRERERERERGRNRDSPLIPAISAVDSGRPPSVYPRSSSVASSNRDSIFSPAATGSSYTSSGTAFLHGHTVSESPPSGPQLFPHAANALHPPLGKQSSMSQPARPRTPGARTTSPGAPLASVARDLADDAEEWVRVLRAEHVAQFKAHKKLAQLELEAKILDVAKWEAEAIVRGNAKKDEFDDVRLRAREDFTQQMQTLTAFQDRQLHEAIASAGAVRREGGGLQNVDMWEENLRAEQEIIMQQIARERRTRIGNYPPSSAGPPPSRQAPSSSTAGTSIQRPDDEASPEFLERNAQRHASGLQHQREEVEARMRQIAQEREEARKREAALTEAARKREADGAKAAQQRRLGEVQRQQAAAGSSTSRPHTPQHRDDMANPDLRERDGERRASSLQRQREEVETRERQIGLEREEACRREAALIEAARKREAEAAEAAQQRRLVERQQATTNSSASISYTPQLQGSGPIPIPARSRKVTVQSESESETDPDDDEQAHNDENTSSSPEEDAFRALSRNPTYSPPSAPTATPVHSRPQSTRQGSAAIDVHAPKTQRKGAPPPVRPPVA